MPTILDLAWLAGFDLFAIWIIFFRGAEMIEGTLFAFLINILAKHWNATGIRFFVSVILIWKNTTFLFSLFGH